nr:chaperone protein ClpB3, chloroplastic [Tanacetum cinerariifolium]
MGRSGKVDGTVLKNGLARRIFSKDGVDNTRLLEATDEFIQRQPKETEHLLKAILEQKNGLARRIFSKDGVDNTRLLEATDEFIQRQPKIDKEYMLSHFVTNENNLSVEYENAITSQCQCTQGTLKAAVVKYPGVGERNKALMILPS